MHRRHLLAFSVLLGAVGVQADTLDKPVIGPQIVCFKYSTFQLAAGERIVDFTGGLEGMSVGVASPRGAYVIGESEIWARPKSPGTLLLTNGTTKVFHFEGKPDRYAIFGPSPFENGDDRLFIWLTLPKDLAPSERDDIFRRFVIPKPRDARCKRGFTYSWDAFIPD